MNEMGWDGMSQNFKGGGCYLLLLCCTILVILAFRTMSFELSSEATGKPQLEYRYVHGKCFTARWSLHNCEVSSLSHRICSTLICAALSLAMVRATMHLVLRLLRTLKVYQYTPSNGSTLIFAEKKL
ncbi:hypothetical protein V8C42DRAFT_333314 [Trichoderma barbatum]